MRFPEGKKIVRCKLIMHSASPLCYCLGPSLGDMDKRLVGHRASTTSNA